MLSKETLKNIAVIAAGSLILTVIMLIIFTVTGNFSSKTLLGAAAGTFYAVLNFTLLGITIERMLSHERQGKAHFTAELSYIARFMLTALFVVWAIKADYINYLAAIIPIIFPQIVIRVYGFVSIRKRSDKNERGYKRT